MTDDERISHGPEWGGRLALLALLAGFLYLAFLILKPYLNPILIAIVITALVHPLFRRLRTRLKGHATVAALLTALIVVLVILGPLALLAIGLVDQGISSVHAIQSWLEGGNLEKAMQAEWLTPVKTFLGRVLPLLDPARIDPKAFLLSASTKLGNLLLAKSGALLSGTGALLGNVVIMLFVLFFALRDGEEMLGVVRRLSPLRSSDEEQLLSRLKSVSRSAIIGAFGTAVAQGLVGGIALWIVGLPALFWGAVMVLASLVPLIGTALIWLPTTGYLLVTGHPYKAAFFGLWCLLIGGTIDNVVRPILMRGAAQMSTLWIFFSVLGGMQLFGLPGLVYGPLVFGLCAVLLFLYQLEFSSFLEQQRTL
jgi:predicted PurR-regulated permease PerM